MVDTVNKLLFKIKAIGQQLAAKVGQLYPSTYNHTNIFDCHANTRLQIQRHVFN